MRTVVRNFKNFRYHYDRSIDSVGFVGNVIVKMGRAIKKSYCHCVTLGKQDLYELLLSHMLSSGL